MMTMELWRQGVINPLPLTRAVIMDLGFSGLIEKIEEYFGKRFSQVLIGFICFVLFMWIFEIFISIFFEIQDMAASADRTEALFGIVLSVVFSGTIYLLLGFVIWNWLGRHVRREMVIMKEMGEHLEARVSAWEKAIEENNKKRKERGES